MIFFIKLKPFKKIILRKKIFKKKKTRLQGNTKRDKSFAFQTYVL